MEDKGLYSRAHVKIEEYLRTREEPFRAVDVYRFCNINSNNAEHKPYRDAIDQVLYNISTVNKKKPTLIKEKMLGTAIVYRKVNYDFHVAPWWEAQGIPFPNFK
jgi:hypothetical protein